ncbi:MAG: tRNA pseudouridine(38-40) synthase TruA [Candidatus Omnitrophota bacterium]
MRNIKLLIEYDGTRFSGWQIQSKARKKTIQQEIQKACEKLLGEKVIVIGSGRTDSGVHAKAQAANFRTKSNLSLHNIKRGLNSYLPKEICVLKVEEAGLDFHAQFDAKGKLYKYTIFNRKERSPLNDRYSTFITYDLDISKMKKAAKYLVGKKDFKSFQASDKKERSSVRTIKRLDIIKKGDIIEILIDADGFLYNMVRNIVGTLIDVGRGRIASPHLKHILNSRNRSSAGETVPAKGLCLERVFY